jgi:hypothetical protein
VIINSSIDTALDRCQVTSQINTRRSRSKIAKSKAKEHDFKYQPTREAPTRIPIWWSVPPMGRFYFMPGQYQVESLCRDLKYPLKLLAMHAV